MALAALLGCSFSPAGSGPTVDPGDAGNPDGAIDSCKNGVKDLTETDLDCGGVCVACGLDRGCRVATDCSSLNCNSAGRCVPAPSCSDGVPNGAETDTDCGGTCPKCADDQGCKIGADCESGVCSSKGRCAAAACTDGVHNGKESDTDCGGPCSPCLGGRSCTGAADCVSAECTPGMLCRAPVSCRALHTARPELKTGVYQLDLDGVGPISATDMFCEMEFDGGGWTFIAQVPGSGLVTPFLGTNVGTYRKDRVATGSLYSLMGSLAPITELLVVIDSSEPSAALAAKRLVIYQIGTSTAFRLGPIPCAGTFASAGFRTTIGASPVGLGTGTICDADRWYPRAASGEFLVMFNGAANGCYWGKGIGGDDSWGHDGWFYGR